MTMNSPELLPGTGARVLLVDDHAAIRLGMRMVVESDAGFTVVGEAENGAVTLAMARALRPDIVLMDLRMPVLDGVAATEQIVARDCLGSWRSPPLTTMNTSSGHCEPGLRVFCSRRQRRRASLALCIRS